MNPSLGLTGYGKDPQNRPPREFAYTVPSYGYLDDVCELSAIRSRMRDALVIPLITPGSRDAERHQLVVLSRDQRRLRFPRRGDRVEVQGRPEILRYRNRDGTLRLIHQVIVERLRVLECGTALNRTIVLTGYLGNRPEIRLNRERDITVTWENPVAERSEPYEGRPGRGSTWSSRSPRITTVRPSATAWWCGRVTRSATATSASCGRGIWSR